MDKRESRPRELTDEGIKAVVGGHNVGHAYGQDPYAPPDQVNLGNGPKGPK
jgi:hypothetical protein